MHAQYSWEQRLAVYAALVRGESAVEVGRTTGVAVITVIAWAKLAGMTFSTGRHGGLTRVGFNAPDPTPDGRGYRRLTLADRSFIQAARALPEPLSCRQIAKELGVAPSTISREVKAHLIRDGRRGLKYSADVAHHHALAARPRRRPGKLEYQPLWDEIVSRLNAKHSPQQTAERLLLDFPNQQEMHVSHETIYQALYVQGKGALRHELTVEKATRTGRTTRKPRSKLPARSERPWLDGARLSDRPAEVEDRAVPGHWEGDLVVGPDVSGVVTLVERSTRTVLLGRLPGRRDSATVVDVLQRMIQELPAELRKTITWDQGQEMSRHAQFTVATGCAVFFCDPHSPWQRGQNENTNGLLRDYFPKGTNFNEVTDQELALVQDQLNDRPRKTLGYRTPREMLNELFTGVALTH